MYGLIGHGGDLPKKFVFQKFARYVFAPRPQAPALLKTEKRIVNIPRQISSSNETWICKFNDIKRMI